MTDAKAQVEVAQTAAAMDTTAAQTTQAAAAAAEENKAKVYVGNLPFSTTDEELAKLFSAAGTVKSAKIIRDKYSGRSKGFGFVEMSSHEEDLKAVKELNDADFGGRKLRVNEARGERREDSQEEKDSRNRRFGGLQENKQAEDPNKLYVGNLPFTTTDDQLAQLLARFGTVKSANVAMDNASGRSKGFGFVVMASSEECQNAIRNLDNQEFDGRSLKVNVARPREERSRFGGFRRGRGGRGRFNRF